MDISRTRPEAVRVNADFALAPTSGGEAATTTSSFDYPSSMNVSALREPAVFVDLRQTRVDPCVSAAQNGLTLLLLSLARTLEERWPGGCRDVAHV